MKKIYLILAIIGFIAPNILVVIESVETGNILLWIDPKATVNGMFANRIASAFVIDLLFAVLVFFIWTYYEGKKYQMKNIWVIWVLTMLFGMAGSLPLFLYLKEKRKDKIITQAL
jgi:hypothetical protein